jgi:hypothetical protein
LADQQDDHGVQAIATLLEVLKHMDDPTRINVLQFVFKALNFTMPGGALDPPANRPSPGAPSPIPPPVREARAPPVGDVADLRSLREQKQPKTTNQMVAIMAYYLANHAPPDQRRDHITPDDIKKYFPQAGFELPTGPPSQALVNAKNGGYLEQIATGQYRLNPVGHNLVTHRLPRSEGAANATNRRRPPKKGKKTPKKKGRK